MKSKENKYRYRILRIRDVVSICGLSPTSLWRRERAGHFPKKIDLGGGSKGWLENEIYQWVEDRVAARDENQTPNSDQQTLSVIQDY